MSIYICLICLICLILFIIINKYLGIHDDFENDNPNKFITYIDKYTLKNILLNDYDNYYKSFYNNDFICRNISTVDEYHEYIIKSVSEFDSIEKAKIEKCILKINTWLLSKSHNIEYFNEKDFYNIPWKIGSIEGKLYENGLPHTRNDIIIISKNDIQNMSEKKLTKTLLHEKVHIYQKLNNSNANIFIYKKNFIKFKQREQEDNIRANPDLDNWIYKNKNTNDIYKAVYNKDAKTIEDITYYPNNSQSFEHPFEAMAIEIENLYLTTSPNFN